MERDTGDWRLRQANDDTSPSATGGEEVLDRDAVEMGRQPGDGSRVHWAFGKSLGDVGARGVWPRRADHAALDGDVVISNVGVDVVDEDVGGTERMACWMAAVSLVTPSPLAPKARTSQTLPAALA